MTFEQVSQPVCARHPDRVTYVLCHRCGNGICPECMVSAPVGFQCRDCVRANRVRVVGPFVPRVTYAIIITCVALQIAGLLGIGTTSGFVDEFSLFPGRIAALGEYYRFITAIFVHAGWLHLGMNMIMFWAMGRTLEHVLGHGKFLALFLLAGIGGAEASYWFNEPLSVGIGASGAIFGMFAATFVFGREARINTQEIITVIGLNLALGFLIPGVDWHAHVGGLIAGGIVGWALLPTRKAVLKTGVPLLFLVVLGALTQIRTQELLTYLATVIHN